MIDKTKKRLYFIREKILDYSANKTGGDKKWYLNMKDGHYTDV